MTLTEFLRARLDEDQVRATMREEHALGCASVPAPEGYTYPCDCGVPERRAAAVAALRQIVEMHSAIDERPDTHLSSGIFLPASDGHCRTCSDSGWEGAVDGHGPVDWPCPTLCALVSAYNRHPDFRPEWALGASSP